MPTRPEAVNGLYLIECALCGITVKSNQITLTKETRLPVCISHQYEENSKIPQIKIPDTVVPYPSNKPEDEFIEYETP